LTVLRHYEPDTAAPAIGGEEARLEMQGLKALSAAGYVLKLVAAGQSMAPRKFATTTFTRGRRLRCRRTSTAAAP
jgi:hypothetical protein